MPKKPDRFELITMKNAWLAERMGPRLAILQEDVAKLLRNEHAWMRRMVQRLKANVDARTKMGVGHNVACDYIMAELDKRRK